MRGLATVLLVLLLLLWNLPLLGQDSPPNKGEPGETAPVHTAQQERNTIFPAGFSKPAPEDPAVSLEEEKVRSTQQRAEVKEQIRQAESDLREQQQEKKEGNAEEVAVGSEEEVRLRLLKQIEVILAQSEQQIKKLEDTRKELDTRKTELQEVLAGNVGLAEPYSFLMLDQLQDELATLESRLSSSELNRDLIQADIVQAKENLLTKEQAWRQARDSGQVIVDAKSDDLSRPGTELRLARETLEYRKRRLEIQTLQDEIGQIRVQIANEKIAFLRPEAVFSEPDLVNKQEELQKRETDLRQRLRMLERAMEESDNRWLSDRLANVQNMNPLESEELELRRLERQLLQARVASLNYRIELINQAQEAWDRRYRFANELTTTQQNIEFEQEAKNHLEQRERDVSSRILQQDELRKSVAALESERDSFADDETGRPLRRVIDNQRNTVRNSMSIIDEDVAAIHANRRILEKLLADIQGDASRYSFASMVQNTWYQVRKIWSTELTNVDDRPITVGKVLLALLIFLGGFFVSRWLSRQLARFLSGRLHVDESAAAAFQSLSFYGLILTFLLGALNLVSIPLTVFTFLGGALAIGVGFGSQNILGNFISGLILMAERPVKVGDFVKMDEFVGSVESIGARSTIIRTPTNLRLIVPNSKILENNVVNYTHGANQLIRTSVSVGVAYGSSTREVMKLLRTAASDHGLILKNPEPFVLFREFGDNSLNFELHFWINMDSPLDRLRIESDLRCRVDSLFRDAGVVVSFPQRDIHMDTTRPIEFRLLRDDPSSRERKKAA